jgi:hypothetical protein
MDQRPPEGLVEEYVILGEPYVFRDSPADYRVLLADLSESLSVATTNITIVGSAKVGFSMNPFAFGRPFRDESDVDVVVVDAERFDRIWFTLLQWDFQVTLKKGFRKDWLRRRREEVYWGWFQSFDSSGGLAAVRGVGLRYLRDVSNEWFSAFQSVGIRHPQLAARKFSGRLYRTWEHAKMYHADSLRKCHESMSPEEL